MRWQLGATEDSMRVVEVDDDAYEAELVYRALIGRGNTAREAARHLADQLREQARLVEACAGLDTNTNNKSRSSK